MSLVTRSVFNASALVSGSFLHAVAHRQVAQRWATFVQSVDASFLKKEVNFKLTAPIRMKSGNSTVLAGSAKESSQGKYSFNLEHIELVNDTIYLIGPISLTRNLSDLG